VVPSLDYETSQAPAEVKRNKMGKLQAATNRVIRAVPPEIHCRTSGPVGASM
jgi:hypothetical protein